MAYKYFDFKCEDCGHIQEELVKQEDMTTQKCELCGGHMSHIPAASGHYTINGDNSASVRPKRTVKSERYISKTTKN